MGMDGVLGGEGRREGEVWHAAGVCLLAGCMQVSA